MQAYRKCHTAWVMCQGVKKSWIKFLEQKVHIQAKNNTKVEETKHEQNRLKYFLKYLSYKLTLYTICN